MWLTSGQHRRRPESDVYTISLFLLASIAARGVGCGPLLIIQRGPKKWGHRLMTIILSSLNRFLKKIFTGKFLGKFVVKWILALPLHPC